MNNFELLHTSYPPIWDEKDKEIIIEIETIIYPSESEIKVIKAVNNIFPNIELSKNVDRITAKSNNATDLYEFCKLIYNQKILDSTRKLFLEYSNIPEQNNSENKIAIYSTNINLNKQLAFYKKISYNLDYNVPLGSINISLKSAYLKEFIDKFFPKFEWFKTN